jgi:hypothetical protein
MTGTVEELEQHIKALEEMVELRDMAFKLEKNREFRKLILENFCVTECARYAQASADPMLKAEQRADSLALAQAAGHLRRYLSVIVQMGNRASADIREAQEAIAEARRENV